MTGPLLKSARLAAGWPQQEAARRLGVSQPYYSQLESGARPVPAALAARSLRVLRAGAEILPLPALSARPAPLDGHTLSGALARLGYPGFTHLKRNAPRLNPALVVAAALHCDDQDIRIIEALPWVLASFPGLDWTWLIAQCRLTNAQNRLGYLVTLAQSLRRPAAGEPLAEARAELERSRLAAEGTLCRESMPTAEREWVRKYRPQQAAHWRLLTTLSVQEATDAA